MRVLRRQLQACTWFALVAMFALALLPSLAHALAHGQGRDVHWTEVCTPQGMQQVAVDTLTTGDASPTPQAGQSLEHCPYCTLTAHAAGMPPAPTRLPDFSGARTYVPPLFLKAPRTQFVWCSAQSRAPPATA